MCRISVAFVDKDGEETDIKVPIGMSMLEAAHENDIELEGKDYNAIFLNQHISFLVDYNWVLCFCNGCIVSHIGIEYSTHPIFQ